MSYRAGVASEKQIAANKKNAARSTGPRTISGKKRSSRNALRHGLAASLDTQGVRSESGLDVEALTERAALIEAERAKIIFEMETIIWEESDKAIDIRLKELNALERYAARSSSALRKKKCGAVTYSVLTERTQLKQRLMPAGDTGS